MCITWKAGKVIKKSGKLNLGRIHLKNNLS